MVHYFGSESPSLITTDVRQGSGGEGQIQQVVFYCLSFSVLGGVYKMNLDVLSTIRSKYLLLDEDDISMSW